MFQNTKERASKMLFDAKDVFQRTASMLSSRGVKVVSGETPSCDGDTIFLPNTMKRYISRDELLLIRFFFSHEQGHIMFTDFISLSGCTANDTTVPLSLRLALFNSLEDIRIEHKMMNKYGGVSYIYDYGREIAKSIWDATTPASEGEAIVREIVSLIYGGHYFPDYREGSVTSRVKQILEPFFEEIDNDVPKIETTVDVFPLYRKILKAFDRLLDDKQTNEQLRHMTSGGSGCQMPSFSGGGVKTLDVGQQGDGGAEETISPEDCAREQPGRGRSEISSIDPRYADDGRAAYKYGVRNAASAGRLLEKFRGLEAGGYSKPRTTGTKIVQRKIAEFLSGQTINILKRRHKHIHRSLAVVICVDDSGSMRDDCDKPAWKATAMLSIACERANVAIQINRFCSSPYAVKDFLDSVSSVSNALAYRFGGGTSIAPAIDLSRNQLRSRREENKIIFLMTDGCGEKAGEIERAIKQAERDGATVVPILFSDAARMSRRYGEGWAKHDPIWINDTDMKTSSFGRKLIERLCSWV